jgi:hypothetical protein
MCIVDLHTLMAGKTYPESGAELYGLLEEKRGDKEPIVLDMTGVTSLPSMFLNVSIGRYIKEHGYQALKNKVSFANISRVQAERIADYAQKVAN